MTVPKEMAMTDTGKAIKTRRPMSPRRRRYWQSLGAAGVIGGIVGGWIVADQPAGRNALEMASTGALSEGFAIGASIFWTMRPRALPDRLSSRDRRP